MSNNNDNDQYPAEHAPSPYLDTDLLELYLILMSIFGGLIGACLLIQSLIA